MQNNQVPLASAAKSLSLNGEWQFRQKDTGNWLPAQVPGCNFSDLLNNGLINDPFYRDEEQRLQWIEQQDWEYRKSFELSNAMLAFADLQLVLAGLDTYCDVYLNNVLIVNSENMFVGQRVSCKEWLCVGDNELHLIFRSPINEVMPTFNRNGFTYPAENDKSVERLSVYTRKAPYHYGWDWGPRFVTSGIWREIRLEAVNKIAIEDINVQQGELTDVSAQLSFQIAANDLQDFNGQVVIRCNNVAGIAAEQRIVTDADLPTIDVPLTIENPKRWWPNGLGEAFLYQFTVSLVEDGQVLASHDVNIGLRTIEVVNEKDELGECFYLKVNGHATFMKGANYIPSDSFLNRVSNDKYQKIFSDAVAANMNMLRVWGGGIYENDEFYRLADEHGILIWQDFMFACSLYPADADFIENVSQEVEYNIKRLRNHACLALWCGNNETEMGMEFWQWPTTFDYSDELYQQLQQDYSLLFKNVLPELVNKLDPSRFYFSSSPIGYWENKDDDNRGDNHYWGVWHGEEPFSEFKNRVPRFMSEYGFQSFPIFDSVKQYSIKEDWHIDSAVMKSHQKHPRGNSLIRQYMAAEYQDPKDFESFLYLSQVQQALGMKIAFEAHRSAMPFCMGTLYWQFNDCWPVASWSGIDYYGRWKALHYQAQRCFKNVAVFIDQVEQTLKVNIVCDLLISSTVELEQKLMTFDGQILWSQQSKVDLEPTSTATVALLPVDSILANVDCNNVVFTATIVDAGAEKPNQRVLSEALHYFVPTKELSLQPTNFSVSKKHQGNDIIVDIVSTTLARQVYLSIADTSENFTDNFFDLLPAVSKRICLPVVNKNAEEISNMLNNLCIMSIVDTYQQTRS